MLALHQRFTTELGVNYLQAINNEQAEIFAMALAVFKNTAQPSKSKATTTESTEDTTEITEEAAKTAEEKPKA